ncbi:MAG: F0F1 ATP synthase subunit B [Acidimicrobiales bacterium]
MLAFILLAAEEGEEAANPILPVLPEIFWGAISFFALWALVKFVLLPPVLKVMDERAARVRADLDAADAARARAGSAATEVSDQLADVRAEAAAIVDAARAEAEAERATILAAAESEAAALKSAAEAEIATARADALSGLGPQVAGLTAQAASKVLDRQVSLDAAQPVVDRYLNNPN